MLEGINCFMAAKNYCFHLTACSYSKWPWKFENNIWSYCSPDIHSVPSFLAPCRRVSSCITSKLEDRCFVSTNLVLSRQLFTVWTGFLLVTQKSGNMEQSRWMSLEERLRDARAPGHAGWPNSLLLVGTVVRHHPLQPTWSLSIMCL